MEDEWKTAMTIIAACMTMGSLILFILVVHVNHRRKNLIRDHQIKTLETEAQLLKLRTTFEIEEREKLRIYRNMHDQVNPVLRIVMRRMEWYKFQLDRNQLKAERLDADIDMITKAIEGIRQCIHELVPAFMLEFGLIKALEDIIRKINSPGIVLTRFFHTNKVKSKTGFSGKDELDIYRICLETINNILQHTKCTILIMRIEQTRDNFLILFQHNGSGVSNEEIKTLTESGKGQGLRSCEARALLLNATFNYQQLPTGNSVEIIIPVKK